MKTLEYSIPKGSSEIDKMHQAARFKRQDLKPASNLRCKLHNIKTKKKNCFFTLFFYSSFSKISHKCLLSGIILTWSQPNWVRRTHSHSEMREWENWPCDTFTFDFECFISLRMCGKFQICLCESLLWPSRHLPAQWRRSGVFIVNFEHISHRVLVFLF